MKMWPRFHTFRQMGILGMNQRNGDFILRRNRRRLYPLVDDKLRTKTLAQQAGIQVPMLYGVVSMQHEVRNLPGLLASYEDFVIKPASGSGGDGVLVISEKRLNRYRKASGAMLRADELEHHVSNIVSGMHSLGGHPDMAMIEYRVKVDPLFHLVAFQGVPDIRTVVYMGYPVMAMVRLPTRASDGKANLHQGAVGVGIDLSTGTTSRGVWQNQVVDEHPDTGHVLSGLSIPNWDSLLELAARCYEISGLGYLGVDVVLDKDLGAMMLEMNARPGLSIQVANQTGLVPRLRLIDGALSDEHTVQERVAFSREQFRFS